MAGERAMIDPGRDPATGREHLETHLHALPRVRPVRTDIRLVRPPPPRTVQRLGERGQVSGPDEPVDIVVFASDSAKAEVDRPSPAQPDVHAQPRRDVPDLGDGRELTFDQAAHVDQAMGDHRQPRHLRSNIECRIRAVRFGTCQRHRIVTTSWWMR
jgi:hypothetical protein